MSPPATSPSHHPFTLIPSKLRKNSHSEYPQSRTSSVGSGPAPQSLFSIRNKTRRSSHQLLKSPVAAAPLVNHAAFACGSTTPSFESLPNLFSFDKSVMPALSPLISTRIPSPTFNCASDPASPASTTTTTTDTEATSRRHSKGKLLVRSVPSPLVGQKKKQPSRCNDADPSPTFPKSQRKPQTTLSAPSTPCPKSPTSVATKVPTANPSKAPSTPLRLSFNLASSSSSKRPTQLQLPTELSGPSLQAKSRRSMSGLIRLDGSGKAPPPSSPITTMSNKSGAGRPLSHDFGFRKSLLQRKSTVNGANSAGYGRKSSSTLSRPTALSSIRERKSTSSGIVSATAGAALSMNPLRIFAA
ncbi:hypothetical protein EV182_003601 [Spiromyces aspiralis]|uniref:Uncharacterized protein n=1 Tax=Spiromyces aspiralis TaxID=68401 RepID=A0ACC1HF77_9FUNG|nr:hypothetical protein EV182_003601 [Spiromyces aspiralis]